MTYYRYHVIEYCAVIGTHSMAGAVDKLLNGHVQTPSLHAEWGLAM